MPKNYLGTYVSEISKTAKKPWRILKIFNKKTFYGWLWSFRPEEQEAVWQKEQELNRRIYDNYEDYVRHQKSKLDRFILDWDNAWINQDYDKVYRERLRERLKSHVTATGASVLCLAARLGTEVKSFIDLGCFGIGIDLNPGKDNKYVVVGDFHQLQFADHSVDIIFTNSLDHVLYPEKILSEVKRVLKNNGRFMMDLSEGGVGEYETLSWSSKEDIISLVEQYSFELIHREEINYPFKEGSFLIFQRI